MVAGSSWRAEPSTEQGAPKGGALCPNWLAGFSYYYQSGWCPGEACGLGGGSAAQARTGEGPRCTTYAVQFHVSSARSDMPIPHRLHGFRHPPLSQTLAHLSSGHGLLVRNPLR